MYQFVFSVAFSMGNFLHSCGQNLDHVFFLTHLIQWWIQIQWY